MNLNLYKVASDYLEACNHLLSFEEVLPVEAIHDTLEGLAGDVEEKALSVAAYYKNLQKEIIAMKEYEKEMRVRRKHLENNADRLKEYLKSNMERCNLTKIKGLEFTLSIRKNPSMVIVDDPYALPQNYIARIDVHPDKNKIKFALQQGEKICGAHLEDGTSLMIR